MKKLILLVLLLAGIYIIIQTTTAFLPNLTNKIAPSVIEKGNTRVLSEESVVIDVIKKVSPSVVSIGIDASSLNQNTPEGPFDFFFGPRPNQEGPEEERYIGSGFVVKSDGIIVTNKHVVSDPGFKYFVVDHKGNKYSVSNVYRDPLNDIAIIKVANSPSGGFPEAELGDSSNLQVGQLAIAVGTPLGEFRNSATTGIVSGLGRGITAGSPFEGFVERLDNVIQTDASINPGNSGGPLLNSSGQVIGVNTAIAQQGQNIGFAIPINVIKDSLQNFNETGQFNRPYLGVSYRMISQRTAVLNEIPEGAYIQEVVNGSSAEKAGIKTGDVITRIDGTKLEEEGNNTLASIISKKKVGDTLTLTVYRDGNTIEIKAILQAAPSQ